VCACVRVCVCACAHAVLVRSLTLVCVAGALLILSLVATGGFLPHAVRAPLAAVQRGPCNTRTTTTSAGQRAAVACMWGGGCGACASGPPEWLVACACHALSHVRVCRRGLADSLSCYYGGLLAPCGASAAGRGSTRPQRGPCDARRRRRRGACDDWQTRHRVGRWAWWQALRSCGVNGCVEQAGRCVCVCACVRARMQCWCALSRWCVSQGLC
jgi:hypothetical protein